jgi:hypothetical protein
LEALISIAKCIDSIDRTSQGADCIATISAVVINVFVQPNEEDILYHLNIEPAT